MGPEGHFQDKHDAPAHNDGWEVPWHTAISLTTSTGCAHITSQLSQ